MDQLGVVQRGGGTQVDGGDRHHHERHQPHVGRPGRRPRARALRAAAVAAWNTRSSRRYARTDTPRERAIAGPRGRRSPRGTPAAASASGPRTATDIPRAAAYERVDRTRGEATDRTWTKRDVEHGLPRGLTVDDVADERGGPRAPPPRRPCRTRAGSHPEGGRDPDLHRPGSRTNARIGSSSPATARPAHSQNTAGRPDRLDVDPWDRRGEDRETCQGDGGGKQAPTIGVGAQASADGSTALIRYGESAPRAVGLRLRPGSELSAGSSSAPKDEGQHREQRGRVPETAEPLASSLVTPRLPRRAAPVRAP